MGGRILIFSMLLFCATAASAAPRALPDPAPIVNGTSAPKRFVMSSIEDPGIDELTWSLSGEVRTKDVEGRGYLELLSTLGNLPAYFSRTQAERGPMQFLSGTSQWRRFVLPFFSQPGAPRPTRLELAVFLPGRGEVEVRNLTVQEHRHGEDPLSLGGGWWSPNIAGWGGAVSGTLIGVLGALVGVLASTRRARRLVLALMGGCLVLGAACLLAGMGAVFVGQPWHVYYALLLLGAVLTLVFGGLFGSVRRRYADLGT